VEAGTLIVPPLCGGYMQFVVRDEGEGSSRRSVAGVDWQFNAWGGKEGGLYPTWDKDQQVAGRILEVSLSS
jgi:agmatine deiminase